MSRPASPPRTFWQHLRRVLLVLLLLALSPFLVWWIVNRIDESPSPEAQRFAAPPSRTVADVDNASILARPLNDLRSLGRELAQMAARGFVGAVLRPHHREDAELHLVRRPPQPVEEDGELVGLDALRSGISRRLRNEEGGDIGLRAHAASFTRPRRFCNVAA